MFVLKKHLTSNNTSRLILYSTNYYKLRMLVKCVRFNANFTKIIKNYWIPNLLNVSFTKKNQGNSRQYLFRDY